MFDASWLCYSWGGNGHSMINGDARPRQFHSCVVLRAAHGPGRARRPDRTCLIYAAIPPNPSTKRDSRKTPGLGEGRAWPVLVARAAPLMGGASKMAAGQSLTSTPPQLSPFGHLLREGRLSRGPRRLALNPLPEHDLVAALLIEIANPRFLDKAVRQIEPPGRIEFRRAQRFHQQDPRAARG